MANLFGFNPEDLIRGMGSALHSLLPAPAHDPDLGPADHVAGSGMTLPAIIMNSSLPMPAGSNWAIPDMSPRPAGRPLGMSPALTPANYLGIPSSSGGAVKDPMGIFGALALQEAVNKKRADANKIPGVTTPGGGGSWAGPATADDNKGITAAKVEEVIAATRANSPMRGKGQLILSEANRLGVSVPEIMGIFLAESELGTTAGPTWNVAGLGGVGNFQGYNNIDDAIKAAIANLATDQYRGKSLEEQIGTWFVGPQGWAQHGVNASDGVNGTVAQYIQGKVAPMYAAFGVPLNQTGTATRTSAPGAAGDLVSVARTLVGTPYQLGGLRNHPNNPRLGIDCSEYTAWIYQQRGITLPQNAQQQYNQTTRVDGGQLQPGDLVFFHGTNPDDPDYVTHVGMYVGGGRMINAQDGGVMEADLNSQYWRDHLAGYGRVGTGGGR